MFKIDGIPGTFLSQHVRKIRFAPTDQLIIDGVISQRYLANIFDGVLAVLVSRDPAGPGGQLLWHLSISHRNGWRNSGEEVFTRLPTWDEIKLARYRFIPPGVAMAMILPPDGKQYVDDHPTTLHLWEVPSELAV